MSHPERMAAIRRLFLSKLEKVDEDMPHDMRIEMARKDLDKVLGASWREEVRAAGVELDPTGDMGCDMQERLDKLPIATRDAGFHGDDVPPPMKKKKEHGSKSIIVRLMKLFQS